MTAIARSFPGDGAAPRPKRAGRAGGVRTFFPEAVPLGPSLLEGRLSGLRFRVEDRLGVRLAPGGQPAEDFVLGVGVETHRDERVRHEDLRLALLQDGEVVLLDRVALTPLDLLGDRQREGRVGRGLRPDVLRVGRQNSRKASASSGCWELVKVPQGVVQVSTNDSDPSITTKGPMPKSIPASWYLATSVKSLQIIAILPWANRSDIPPGSDSSIEAEGA